MRKAPKRGHKGELTNLHFVAGVFPGFEHTHVFFVRPDQRYSHNIHVPKMSGQTSFPSFSAVAGGSEWHFCPSKILSCLQCYTSVEPTFRTSRLEYLVNFTGGQNHFMCSRDSYRLYPDFRHFLRQIWLFSWRSFVEWMLGITNWS